MNDISGKHHFLLKTICFLGTIMFLQSILLPAQEKPLKYPTPVRQSTLTPETAGPAKVLTLRDVARGDRWLGVEIRQVRWSPDGKSIFFRWQLNPSTEQNPDLDPWFRVDRWGQTVEQVPDSQTHLIPAERVSWDKKGKRATWISNNNLYLYDASNTNSVRTLLSTDKQVRNARILPDGRAVHFMVEEDLFQYDINTGGIRQLTRKHVKSIERKTEAAQWLKNQQLELFERHREAKQKRETIAKHRRELDVSASQAIPLEKGVTLSDVQLSPDGQYVIFQWQKPTKERKATQYLDFLSGSGYAEVREARAKVGEQQDEFRMGIVRFDPTVKPDNIEIVWVDYEESDSQPAIIYGPYWSLEGDRAVVQVVSQGHKDRWISQLDLDTGKTTPIVQDHDDAWLGGPPPLAGYLRPALLEWLPGGRFVFASERSGWCHLYLAERNGTIRSLTEGFWEVRDAQLSRDRSKWIVSASREHPSDDHLYIIPAAGGQLVRLTEKQGRHTGQFSPDGKRLAVVYSESIQMPDLYLCDAKADPSLKRITVSGADNYYRHSWMRPEIVSFQHPDGGLVWAALFLPKKINPQRAAILHIHGGGYRQFSHRGWTVYGYASHLGLINYLVQEGYPVLDFDYRGSAGFGRDYRTDIYRSMGIKDVDGAKAAVEYLVKEQDIDRSRIGLYGISYGGFFTLMSLFRHPGVFAAGVANASVTDWAHYSHLWTSRVLNKPSDDPEAYQISSPINYASGLEDSLLLVHGLIDGNVQFQDAARLVQKLIELEKEFEVMYYPLEPHGFTSESSRYDYFRRLTSFFQRHLLR